MNIQNIVELYSQLYIYCYVISSIIVYTWYVMYEYIYQYKCLSISFHNHEKPCGGLVKQQKVQHK